MAGPVEWSDARPMCRRGSPHMEAGTIPNMQDPFDCAFVLSPTVRPGVHCGTHDPEGDDPSGDGCSPGRAGHLCDAVEEVGDAGAALVGAQVLDGCGQALVGSDGVEGGVVVEEGVPVGEGGFEVAEA